MKPVITGARSALTNPIDSTYRDPRYVGHAVPFLEAAREHEAAEASRRKWNVPAAVAVFAGTIFTLASAGTNFIYGISKSPELPQQVVWGSVAVAASLALALSPSALMRSIAGRSVAGFAFSLAALVLFGAFSLTGALGSAFGNRASSQAEKTESDGTRSRLQRSYDAAQTELTALSPTRPVEELDATLSKLKTTPGANGCAKEPDGPISRRVCSEAATAAVELGRAKRRAELETILADATEALGKLGTPKVVNADATAISTFAGKLGITVQPEELNPWLALLAVLLVEFGGGICFAVAGVFTPVRVAVRGAPKIEVAETLAASSLAEHPARPAMNLSTLPSTTAYSASTNEHGGFEELANSAPSTLHGLVPLAPVMARDASTVADRLKAYLHAQGGAVTLSTRKMADALACRPSTLADAVEALENAGVMSAESTRQGTVYRLATTSQTA